MQLTQLAKELELLVGEFNVHAWVNTRTSPSDMRALLTRWRGGPVS